MTDHRDVRINRDATSAFALLAGQAWLDVTDDSVVPDELGDLPEFYFRTGMLAALQLVGQARRQRRWAPLQGAIDDALAILDETR